MKKNIILSLAVSLSIIAAAAIFTLTQSMSPQDKLLIENVAALANDPNCLMDEGEGGGGGEMCWSSFKSHPSQSARVCVSKKCTNVQSSVGSGELIYCI
jgi:hypothetical protein